ncbi:DUF2268 domain-containing putative Zn-dependent protease [Deinococcus sp. VB142]|uniref:DUF2268 domain-containing putative Zn-dependent protease n=1 Tax=Deinococcus sp. VB142 TaxID=3112952 RepID=A0AAU6Q1N1_9DEIO
MSGAGGGRGTARPCSKLSWFFGSAEQQLPRWGGYALGYELVRRFLARAGENAVHHADTPASAFEGAWSRVELEIICRCSGKLRGLPARAAR